MNNSKYFNDWAKEDERQALKVLERMLRGAQGMLVGKEERVQEIREAAAEALTYHAQSEAIKSFAAAL